MDVHRAGSEGCSVSVLHGVSAILHRKSWLVVHGMVWGKMGLLCI